MEERFEYNFAYTEYKKISKYLSEKGYRHNESGSLRRKKEDIGDIDIVICGEEKEVLDMILKYEYIDYRINNFEFMLKSGISMHVIPESEEMYNYTLWQSTGSKEHVKKIKKIYSDKNKEITKKFNFENEIYEKINFDYLKPEERRE